MNEEEEKIPKASPLTLIGALKAVVKGKKVERKRKRKRAKVMEVPKELVHRIEHEEESDSQEIGRF